MKDQKDDALKDEELMKRYQMGHEEAFNVLYSRYGGKVYGYIKKKLHNNNLAEDAFQFTFLKMHKARSTYDSTKPFAPWLFTICKTAIVDVLRISPVMDEYKETPVAEAPKPNLPSLEGLSDRERRVIELRYENDQTFEQIASKLETTAENARKILSRAVQKVRLSHGKEK